MDFLLFIFLSIVSIVLILFGYAVKSLSFSAVGAITMVILGALVLQGGLTQTQMYPITNNSTVEWVNTTVNLLEPPMDYAVPLIWIFVGVVGLILPSRSRGGGSGGFELG